ncbi:hypothetical protein RU820_05545 [Acidithiobacillus ferrooxidans]|uniref:hypothetical protein n=1 Tax=Acidithiobacillus ferrooxidans TaxID=920 RepID=UPI0002F5190E|nr:hypothetical protein [Acidithiobacillus ferrooxidans]
MSIQAKSEIAQMLMDKLKQVGFPFEARHFDGNLCIGLSVQDFAQAFHLGTLLGLEFGTVAHDKIGSQRILIFQDALVELVAD